MLYDPSKEYNEDGLILLKAAQYIEEHGHCKNKLHDEKGHVCLLGAVRAAISGVPTLHPRNREFEERTHRSLDILRHNFPGDLDKYDDRLVGFNDDPETTAQQVIDLLRKAAETCKVGAF